MRKVRQLSPIEVSRMVEELTNRADRLRPSLPGVEELIRSETRQAIRQISQ